MSNSKGEFMSIYVLNYKETFLNDFAVCIVFIWLCSKLHCIESIEIKLKP